MMLYKCASFVPEPVCDQDQMRDHLIYYFILFLQDNYPGQLWAG
jgi:hypothetical protein